MNCKSILISCLNFNLVCDNKIKITFLFQWLAWPQVFSLQKRDAGHYIISYFFYIFWAIVFASLSASLVRMFAPYACGSGIPEVNITFSYS